ncbi:MAG: cysteine hydrolase [Desulfomicrobiaceae bacterium]|nr:cysteine hydrolase [Desulfomicrobiaceae bacterium]
MSLWDDLLTPEDREVIRRAGYGRPQGLGQRPVVVVVDAQYNYCGGDCPILEQLDAWPSGAGEAAWRAVEVIARLLSVARRRGVPVLYTRQVHKAELFDGFSAKAGRDPGAYLEEAPGTRIVAPLKPGTGDLVIEKSAASAFCGTPLLGILIKLQADTLLVTGGSTSGCVRALCVDAVSYHFKVAVITDAVFDRITASHKVALLDLWMKYCDLLSLEEALRYLEALPLGAGPC